MEQVIGILFALALWILPTLLSARKKAMKQAPNMRGPQQAQPEASPMDTLGRLFEELADDNDEMFGPSDFEDDEPLSDSDEEAPFGSADKTNPFVFVANEQQPRPAMQDFSNKTVLDDQPLQDVSHDATVNTTANNALLDEPFDLRKAFIYQTILHNKYVTN